MSIEELKRAIEAVPTRPSWISPVVWDVSYRKDGPYQRLRAEAWKAAFEWMHWLAERYAEEIGSYCPHTLGIDAERKEGMELIREKLR